MTVIRTNFEQRNFEATRFELTIRDKLIQRGWTMSHTGIGGLSDGERRTLVNFRDSYGYPTLFRWFPDWLATRFPLTFLVDAKTAQSNTDNYSIEVDAVEAYEVIERWLHHPVCILVPGDKVLTVRMVLNKYCRRDDGSNANGSRTSYYLIKKHLAITTIDDVFGGVRA